MNDTNKQSKINLNLGKKGGSGTLNTYPNSDNREK